MAQMDDGAADEGEDRATAGEDGIPATERGFDLTARLRSLEGSNLRRSLDPVESVGARTRRAPDPGGTAPTFDDEALVFASNDYLGLAGDDRLAEAAARAAREVGTGAGASRLVTGDTAEHRDLERALAESKDAERALVFSSGYAANVGTITALDPDAVFSDARNHASIIDGCRLSGADVEVYPHCDPDGLAGAMRERLAAVGGDPREDGGPATAGDGDGPVTGDDNESWLVVTDSVFSMDGDVAPLAELCDVAERFGAWVMVDEAHATGLYEDAGGVVQREGLADRVDVQLGTLSKALGAQGGFVAGDQPLVEYLVNAARAFVFSTGLAPPAAAAAGRALEVARESDVRERLWDNVAHLRDGLESLGYVVQGETQILPVHVGDRAAAVALDERLREAGVLAPAIRPPTVPEGESLVRVAPMATHDRTDLNACLQAFADARCEVDLP